MGRKTGARPHDPSLDRSIRKTAETNPAKTFVFRWKWQAIYISHALLYPGRSVFRVVFRRVLRLVGWYFSVFN